MLRSNMKTLRENPLRIRIPGIATLENRVLD